MLITVINTTECVLTALNSSCVIKVRLRILFIAIHAGPSKFRMDNSELAAIFQEGDCNCTWPEMDETGVAK